MRNKYKNLMAKGGKITSKTKKRTVGKGKGTKVKSSKFLGNFHSYGVQPLSEPKDTGDTFQDKKRQVSKVEKTISTTGKVKTKKSSRGTFYSTARTNVFKGGM